MGWTRQEKHDWRPRVNQPTGFVAATHMRPTYYYGKKHSYAYYPQSWTDVESGTRYEKGYYDENGRRYDNVAFEENGRYRSVVCHCPYCGQDTILDLNAGELGGIALTCRHCGGPMEISSELDVILRETPANTHVYQAEESLKKAFPKRKKRRLWPIAAAVLLALSLLGRHIERNTDQPSGGQVQIVAPLENRASDRFGAYLYLERQPDGSYHVVTDPIRAHKILPFDRDADSYYDETSDCWLWYNTNVEPAVWQYWYEGISGDFGEWGWMEHDSQGWYIEESEGKWIPLPPRYDASGLWYLT